MKLTGIVYRAHNPRWAFLPDAGEGAALFGGRFNAKGVPALYTSFRMETAWLEAQQGFAFKAQPMTMVAYNVDCTDIVDLTDPAENTRHGFVISDLATAWELIASTGGIPPTWEISRRLRSSGAAGIIVPSFAPGADKGDRNAVFWDWSPVPDHQVRVIDDFQRLPANDASWSSR